MKIIYFNPSADDENDLAAECAFDYKKAKLNRFALQNSNSTMTVIVLKVVKFNDTSNPD